MQVQCDCGTFKAEIATFPKNTPGLCICYCDDCQTYMHTLGRPELLDKNGGTEIVPVYPTNFKIISGQDSLQCTRISSEGPFRFSTTCCQTPIANTTPKFPWVGMVGRQFKVKDPNNLNKTVGPIKSKINGKYAQGGKPTDASEKIGFKDFCVIFPFLLKGFLFGKAKNSPFFKEDQMTPIAEAKILTLEQRNQIREKLGFQKLNQK